MTAAEAIRERLLAISAVTELVGTRVFLLMLPQKGTLPAVRVQGISEAEPMHLRGSVRVLRSRVQVDSVVNESSGLAAALALDAAVHGAGDGTALCGWTGSVGSSPATDVLAVLPIDRRDAYDGGELRQVKVMRDYWVWHT